MITPTRATTQSDIDKAENERWRQAVNAALADSSPYPEHDWQMASWCRRVNRKIWKALKRVN